MHKQFIVNALLNNTMINTTTAFSNFLWEKHKKHISTSQPAFGLGSTQTLVKIFNTPQPQTKSELRLILTKNPGKSTLKCGCFHGYLT